MYKNLCTLNSSKDLNLTTTAMQTNPEELATASLSFQDIFFHLAPKL